MKSYNIQHDYLFASSEITSEDPPHFDVVSNRRERVLSLPIRISSLMKDDGEKMLDAFAKMGRYICLIDDLPHCENPIVASYRKLIIKGVVAEFHKRGRKVFQQN